MAGGGGSRYNNDYRLSHASPRSGDGVGLFPRTTVVAESAPMAPHPIVSGSPEDKFREFLEIRGEKLTEPRRILVRHVFDSHKHFDADELVDDLRSRRASGQPVDGLPDAPAPRRRGTPPRAEADEPDGV